MERLSGFAEFDGGEAVLCGDDAGHGVSLDGFNEVGDLAGVAIASFQLEHLRFCPVRRLQGVIASEVVVHGRVFKPRV